MRSLWTSHKSIGCFVFGLLFGDFIYLSFTGHSIIFGTLLGR